MIGTMKEPRRELTEKLRAHYRASGWKVAKTADGLLEAVGPHGVKWLGRAVVAEDLRDEAFETEILDLADRRMPNGGELCPLDLLPAPDCATELRELLDAMGLGRNTHISVYSVAA